MKKQDEEDVEKLIKSLLSLISHDYNCDCHLDYNTELDHNTRKFYLYSYAAAQKQALIVIFVGKEIKDQFDDLNDLFQTFLDPTYETWIYDIDNNRHRICIAKEYGSTVEQLKITFDLRAIS